MDIEIDDFLPKYEDINRTEIALFNQYTNSNFYESLYFKKEFYDEKLTRVEKIPTEPGQLFKHQKIISRFLSSHTPYNELLLAHSMGTGKSCSAIGVIEQIRSEGGNFRGALVIAPGKGLLDNFIQEIALKCTRDKYLPANYYNIRGETNRMHALRQAVKHFYKFRTYMTLAKDIQQMIIRNIPKDDPDREQKMYKNIRERFSNLIIIMDEVHHLRPKPNAKKDERVTYEMIKLLCRVTSNRKILLMSGTPMRDGPEEIASIMNLILPKDIPIGKEFISTYLEERNDNTYRIKKSKINDLKNTLRGRVSVLNAMESEVTKKYIGVKGYYNMIHSIIDIDEMSEFQSIAYTEAFSKDTKVGKSGQKGGIYSNSRQADLFVYPPKQTGGIGIYGPEGFKEYINVSKKSRKMGEYSKSRKATQIYSYSLKEDFKNQLKGHDNNDTLQNIAIYSSKYAKTIQQILDANGKSVFIYSEFVTGSGSILFTKLLELVGYSKASGGETTKSKRYALLTNLTSTVNEVNKLKNRFNQKDNMNGEYIQVIIGSSIITEGFSLSNVQEEHLLTPYWNSTPIEQAIARGLRVGSHQNLINTGIRPIVNIYQHASIPLDYPNTKSIDLIMYKLSEAKDISIKQIERVMKESAFDCGLVYNRNKVIDGLDGSKKCDYQKCDYVCDGLSVEEIERDIPNSDLDYSTFQLYYSKDNIIRIIEKLESMFRTNFSIQLENIIENFPEYSGFELLSSLRLIINQNKVITNKFGFPNYLKEENNLFFLIDKLSDISSYFSSYYTKSPVILTNKSFTDLINEQWINTLPVIIKRLQVADQSEFEMQIKRLPPEIQETYIEASILARKQGKQENIKLQNKIHIYFKNYISEIDGIWVSTYLKERNNGSLRCLIDNNWTDCEEDMQLKIEAGREDRINRLLNNKYGYYGIIDKEVPDWLSIRKIEGMSVTDLRKKTTGQNCKSWKKENIIPLAISLQLDYEVTPKLFKDVDVDNRKQLEKFVLSNTAFKKVYKDTYKTLSDDDLKRAYYWSKISLNDACPKIKEWFLQHDLFDYGTATTTSKKKTDVPQK